MLPPRSAAAAVALAGMTLANPVKLTKKSTFSVDQVAVPRTGAFPHPAQQIAQTYHKYGASSTIPEDVTKVADAAGQGEVSASPVQNDSVSSLATLCPMAS